MKLHYEPTVRLISHPVIVTPALNDFLKNETSDKWKLSLGESYCDQIPEFAGRLCYMSFDNPRPGGNKTYLERIKGEGHGSVMEHVNFGVLFTGVSRSLTHELVRHRAGTAYSQLSQRYVDESQAEYVVPWELKEEVRAAMVFMKHQGPTDYAHEVAKRVEAAEPDYWKAHGGPEWVRLAKDGMDWLNAIQQAHNAYVKKVDSLRERHMLRRMGEKAVKDQSWIPPLTTEEKTKLRKAARGAARSLLPNATETKILVTANVRAWRHMIEKRCDPAADAEIRIAFHKAYRLLKGYAPNLFADYTEVPLDDETTALTTPTPKV